jgi:hypothetical protein
MNNKMNISEEIKIMILEEERRKREYGKRACKLKKRRMKRKIKRFFNLVPTLMLVGIIGFTSCKSTKPSSVTPPITGITAHAKKNKIYVNGEFFSSEGWNILKNNEHIARVEAVEWNYIDGKFERSVYVTLLKTREDNYEDIKNLLLYIALSFPDAKISISKNSFPTKTNIKRNRDNLIEIKIK